MKILHLIAGELDGGAARGACWLHRALRKAGAESKILTDARNIGGDPDVSSIAATRGQKLMSVLRHEIEQLPVKLYPARTTRLFGTSLAGYAFTRHPLYAWADIIHLHWVNGGFVSISHLARMKKPAVWTLRDMWPLTGGCHYSMSCENFKTGCGRCPQLGSSLQWDLSRLVVKLKRWRIPRDMRIVAISQWLAGAAKNSAVFHDFDVSCISNNVDCSVFSPVDKKTARALLGIDTAKRIILAGAQYQRDPYKGFDKLASALKDMDPGSHMLLLFGQPPADGISIPGLECRSLGFLHDDTTLRLAYSAADVFAAPSLMDAFGKTLAESMACKTPVVCFDATGPKDIVDHMLNGYRAKPFDSADFAEGLKWVLAADNYEELRKDARRKAETSFDSSVIAAQYLDLYRRMLADV